MATIQKPKYEYVIYGKYKNEPWEELDTAETASERDYLLGEYRMAFGAGWSYKTSRRKVS